MYLFIRYHQFIRYFCRISTLLCQPPTCDLKEFCHKYLISEKDTSYILASMLVSSMTWKGGMAMRLRAKNHPNEYLPLLSHSPFNHILPHALTRRFETPARRLMFVRRIRAVGLTDATLEQLVWSR